mgnify:CR=1 FL=1
MFGHGVPFRFPSSPDTGPGLTAAGRDLIRRCNGLGITASRGAKVHAAYFGRVIYADWLQGQGLLLIVEHNDGYLTLYGHNEVLYKTVGDWVAPGDVIGSLAEGEGAAKELYFEVRAGRKPVDPRAWLAAGG